MQSRLVPIVAISALATLVFQVACGASEAPGGTGGSSSSGTGGSGANTNTTSGSGGGETGGFNPGTGGSGGQEACLTSQAEATQSPLDIVVLLDRSSSMAGGLWDGTVNALTQFFNDPGGTDISAAMSYFPAPGGASECLPSSYNPTHVPMSDLATDASVLVSNLQGQSPAGDYTPTYAGLYGALLYANAYQDSHPDHVVIAVLASDGDPTSCDTNVGNIASLAATALAYNGVKTFAIAIQGATLSNLDQIAMAGGTGQALDVTGDVTQLKAKMDEIRQQILACEFIIPEPEVGEEFDPTKVNVDYTPGGSTTADSLPQAADLADCGNDPGWYYDNPAVPTKISLCPASCDDIQSDPGAKIDFVFGCPTVVK